MENSFKIYFLRPIFKNINELIFEEDKNNIYYNGSHMNYICVLNTDDIEYKFIGFYKDNYFVIIFDSFDKNLQTNIKNKNVILLKLNWKKTIYQEKEIYVIAIDKFKNLKMESFILNIRKKLLDITNISIEDYLKVKNFEIIDCRIDNLNNNNNNNNIIIKLKELLQKFN
jgi:hypothetical protein